MDRCDLLGIIDDAAHECSCRLPGPGQLVESPADHPPPSRIMEGVKDPESGSLDVAHPYLRPMAQVVTNGAGGRVRTDWTLRTT